MNMKIIRFTKKYKNKIIVINNIFLIIILLLLFSFLIGCENPNNTQEEVPEIPVEIPLQDISISIDNILFVNEDKYLSINYFPTDTTEKELIYYSSNNEILSIDNNGKIIPKKKGVTEITVISKNNEEIIKTVNVSVYEIITKSSIINTSEQWGPYEKIVGVTSGYLGINKDVEIIINNNTIIDIGMELSGKIITNNTNQLDTQIDRLVIRIIDDCTGIFIDNIMATYIYIDGYSQNSPDFTGYIRNSIIDRFTYTSHLWRDFEFEISRNIFKNSFSVQPATNGQINNILYHPIIRNNLFLGNFSIRYFRDTAPDFPNFNYNTIDINSVIFSDSTTPKVDFANNYWCTTDTSLIDELIIDRNDRLSINYYVNYLPILQEKAPLTPDKE